MKTYMYLLAGAVPAVVPVLADAATPEQRPNILFILSDDHTSQSWGIYGGVLADYARNENIRRLAAEGVVLDNCFCTNSISVPSRASILTGRYSHRNGVYTLEQWQDLKFGVIIHWGLYSVPGIMESWNLCGGDLDWIQRPADMTYEEYKQWYFLLGVGPNGEGVFDDKAVAMIKTIGQWMKKNGQAIYGTKTTPHYNDGNVWFTADKNGQRMYAIYALPETQDQVPETVEWTTHLPKGKKVTLVANGRRLKCRVDGDRVTVWLPADVDRTASLAMRFEVE